MSGQSEGLFVLGEVQSCARVEYPICFSRVFFCLSNIPSNIPSRGYNSLREHATWNQRGPFFTLHKLLHKASE